MDAMVMIAELFTTQTVGGINCTVHRNIPCSSTTSFTPQARIRRTNHG